MDANLSTQPFKHRENGPSINAINFVKKLERLRQALEGLPVKPPSIYLDAHGVAQDEIINLQILVPPIGTLYLVDIKRLGTAALSATADNSASLRSLLESKSIPKVGFDIRAVSKLLFRDFSVSLDGMYDLQLMELASRNGRHSKKHLAGFAKCVDQDVPKSNTTKSRWLQPDDTTNMHLFNSLGYFPSMKRIELYPALWAVYRYRLSKPWQAFWLSSARAESWQRVQGSKLGKVRQGEQSLGPTSWWSSELLESAMECWNEEIFTERMAGDYELNEDAEWVPLSMK
uniref:3'-5' exonuclease domain-containing protein n=1 Tax=Bionectria ochroleuca TaxID=29856 RepID=A0A8H7K8N0_BIOOC